MEKHDILMMVGVLSLVSVFGISTGYAAVDEDDAKDLCEGYGGDWKKKGECGFDSNDKDKAIKFGEDYTSLWEINEEKSELEDDESDIKRFSNDDDDEYNDKIKVINSDDGDDNKKYGVTSKQGENDVTSYYKDKDDAEEAYEDLERDELTHSDKSYSDWEYDDEEHPALR